MTGTRPTERGEIFSSDLLTLLARSDGEEDATEAEAAGFASFMEGYKCSIAVERAAVQAY